LNRLFHAPAFSLGKAFEGASLRVENRALEFPAGDFPGRGEVFLDWSATIYATFVLPGA